MPEYKQLLADRSKHTNNQKSHIQTFISDIKSITQAAFHSQILIISVPFSTSKKTQVLLMEDMNALADKLYHHPFMTDADDVNISREN